MDLSRRSLLGGAAYTAGAAFCVGDLQHARAEVAASFPSRRIRMVAPFAAGGTADVLCRKIGASMGAAWNQTVITENKVGAGGVIGATDIARSAPDGYTLGMLVPGILIQGFLDDKPSFDVTRDLAPISCVVQNPKCIVVNADVPAATLQDLIELVRKDPARYGSYGTSGFGSRAHVAMATINDLAKTKFVHVPYRGGSAVIPDLIGGTLPIGILDLGNISAQLNSGKIKVIAITGATRSSALPNVQTVAETFPGFHAEEWYALVTPAETPSDIIDKINGEVKRWVNSASGENYAKTFGVELIGGSPAELRQFIAAEQVSFAKLIPQLNIKAEANK